MAEPSDSQVLIIKKMKRLIYVLCFFLPLLGYGQTGYKIGDKVNNFTLINAIDTAKVSLNDQLQSKGLVIVFTSNDCPYSKLYEERIIEIAKEFKNKGINFILINPNSPKNSVDDNMESMIRKSKEKSYFFPYLIDSKQTVANIFGASRTPEVFILKNINGSFVLVYKGAIDDNPQLASDVTTSYLKNASISIIGNKAIKTSETRATGCMIKR